MKKENIERAKGLGKTLDELNDKLQALESLNDDRFDIRIETYSKTKNGYFQPGYMNRQAYEAIRALLIYETKKRIKDIEAQIETL